ncbi:cysteine desulfurase [bacterium]|nr:cysteine desulfurase [bacterium]
MCRKDFPFLSKNISDELIYLDSAATSQKPNSVIQKLHDFYSYEYAPVHRGIYSLGEKSTIVYEDVRRKIKNFIGASDACEVIFTKGTTEGINFVATAWAQKHLKKGDEIVLTHLEHHSNLIPWQQIALKKGVILKFIPITKDGYLDLTNLDQIITKKTKLVSFAHVSNVLGTHAPVKKIVSAAKSVGAKVLIDAAQSSPHKKIDVKSLDCDFLVFSSHKMLGPSGVGILYIKKSIQDEVAPYQFGGSMVCEVFYDQSTFQQPPYRYEAGTPPIAQVVGLGAAIDYYKDNIGWESLKNHEASLCTRTIDGLSQFEQIRILGPVEQLKNSGHLVSFVVEDVFDVHAHDVAAYLDTKNICVRAGHHCAQPLHKELGIKASIRVSFHVYNTLKEVELFLFAIEQMLK